MQHGLTDEATNDRRTPPPMTLRNGKSLREGHSRNGKLRGVGVAGLTFSPPCVPGQKRRWFLPSENPVFWAFLECYPILAADDGFWPEAGIVLQ